MQTDTAGWSYMEKESLYFGHKNRACFARPRNFSNSLDYSAEIAPVGHSLSQVPHSRHASASITYLPSPSLIAPAGHASAHVPQLTHSSEITYAIILVLLNLYYELILIHKNQIYK